MAFLDFFDQGAGQAGGMAPGTQGETRIINGAPFTFRFGQWLPSSPGGQTSFEQAQQANKARLDQIMGLVQGAGTQEAGDIRRRFANVQSGGMQDLVSRGLRASTLAPALQAGVARQETGALGALGERVRQQQAGILERVEEEFPDVLLERMFGGALGPTGIPLSTNIRIGGRRRTSRRRRGRRRRTEPAPFTTAFGDPSPWPTGGRNVVKEQFMARRRAGGFTGPGATPATFTPQRRVRRTRRRNSDIDPSFAAGGTTQAPGWATGFMEPQVPAWGLAG